MVLVIALGCPAWAIHKKAGVSGAQFLKIGVGARPAAMGEAFVAVSDDVTSIYWNPAGLLKTKDKELVFVHNQWLEDTSYQFIGFSQATEKGKMGIGLSYLGYGEMIGRDKEANPTGNFTAFDMALSLSYSQAIKEINTGATLKLIHQKNEQEQAQTIALDLGMQTSLKDNLLLGASLSNLGPKIKFISQKDPLPLTTRIGVFLTPFPNFSLLSLYNLKIACDVVKPIDDEFQINYGTEYQLKDISFRLGYQTDSDFGITTGLGLKIGSYQLDYAYIPWGDLRDTHRFSILFTP